MPSPTPVKMAPPASPRRAAGTWASTAGAATTINAPPAIPAEKRQPKNHTKESGIAQPKNVAVASNSIPRKAVAVPMRAATGRPSNAPTR